MGVVHINAAAVGALADEPLDWRFIAGCEIVSIYVFVSLWRKKRPKPPADKSADSKL